MIQAVGGSNRAAFLELCGRDPVFGPQLSTDYSIFGENDPSTCFWVLRDDHGAVGGVLGSQGKRLILLAESTAVLPELHFFLRGWDGCVLLGEEALLQSIGEPALSAPVLEYGRPPVTGDTIAELDLSPPLLEVHHLLAAVGGAENAPASSRDFWYTTTSHLVRHRLGQVIALRRQGELVATGGICASHGAACTIGNVATLPSCRRQGLGTQIVRGLLGSGFAGARKMVLLCARDSLLPFYTGLGFRTMGRWAKIVLGE